jgi:hypothetical protein
LLLSGSLIAEPSPPVLFPDPPCALAPEVDTCRSEQRLRLFGEGMARPADCVLPPKRFWLATGEIFLVNLLPWIYGRYIVNGPIAYVSTSSWATNLRNLPNFYRTFDQDSILVNQVAHPGVSGNFYFNAARTNGYSFWESVPFVLAGSLLWETFGETERVDVSDVTSTFLGGINWGEISYRSSRMLLDNEATGVSRILREFGDFVLDPAGAVTRLVTGDMWRVGPNPDDRLPSSLVAILDAGYRHRGNENPEHPEQAFVSGILRYGDPFEGQSRKPFDVFQVSAEFAGPSSTPITRFQAFGLVADGELSSNRESEHRICVVLAYDYQNSLNRVYQDESLGLRLLSRFALPGKADLRTDVGIAATPLAAVESDYPAQNRAQPSQRTSIGNTIGRSYDYAPGGSAEVTAHIRRDEVDLVAVGYVLRLVHSINGISNDSRVQTAFAEGRIPLNRSLAAGAGWTWDERLTKYDALPTVHHSAAEWRLFASWILR